MAADFIQSSLPLEFDKWVQRYLDSIRAKLKPALNAFSAWLQLGTVMVSAIIICLSAITETNMNDDRKTKRTGWTIATLGVITTLGLVAGTAGSAMASEKGQYGQPKAASEIATSGQYLSMEQVVAELKQQGFGDVYEVERERGAYEVKARNPQGDMVKLYVDPRTGKVLRHKLDD